MLGSAELDSGPLYRLNQGKSYQERSVSSSSARPDWLRSRPLRFGLALCTLAALTIGAPEQVRASHEGRTLQVTPETDRNPMGTVHQFVATISPPAGDEGSVLIDYKIRSGPNAVSQDPAMNLFTAPDGTCTIPAGSASCTLLYTDRRAYAGTDNIFVWIDHDGDNATAEVDEAETYNAGGPPDEPGCPEPQCGPPDDSGAGDTTDPDTTDVILKEWGQLRTASLPYVDGAGLFLASDPTCEKKRTRRDGRVVLTTNGCLSTFAVSSELESDDLRDHGALWAQGSVKSRRGWCTTRVVSRITVPDGVEILGTSPPSSAPGDVQVNQVALPVGDTTIMGSVPILAQSFLAFPDEITMRQNVDGDVIRLVWKGRSSKKVALALGAWVSFSPGEDVAELDVGSGVATRAVKRASC